MPGQAVSKLNKILARGLRHAGPIIFALSWVVRVISLLLAREPIEPGVPIRDVEIVYLAKSIVAGQGFANPFGCLSGATAHLAPVFPYLLGFIYRVFPAAHHTELAVKIVRITIVSVMYALLPWLAERLRLDRRIGVFAGLAGSAIPVFFWLEVRDQWEAPLTALLLVAGLGMFANLFGRSGLRQTAATGAVWGVALLNAPTLALSFAALFFVWIWQCRLRIAAEWRLIPALLMPLILVLTPWTMRNYLVFHNVFFIRQNLGLELHMAFNPVSQAALEDNLTNGAYRDHPTRNPEVCAQFGRVGEPVMNREYKRQALQWVGANPAKSARLMAQRFVAFWRMELPGNATRTLASEALTLAAFIGLGLCFRRHIFAAQLTGLVLLTYPLIYYVVHFDTRYRYPLEPIIILLACLFFVEIPRILHRSRDRRTGG
jgi:hypothetical protein